MRSLRLRPEVARSWKIAVTFPQEKRMEQELQVNLPGNYRMYKPAPFMLHISTNTSGSDNDIPLHLHVAGHIITVAMIQVSHKKIQHMQAHLQILGLARLHSDVK